MKTKTKKWLALATACTALAVTAVAAMDHRLTLKKYTVRTHKVTQPIRLALVTDLHSCDYGPGQRELLDMVEDQEPDAVLLGGDIVDDDPAMPEENAWTAVQALAKRYPTFYVTGNHEFWTHRVEAIKTRMARFGVTVLAGECETVLFQGQPVDLCGVDDPAVGADAWAAQLEQTAGAAAEDYFTILLTHRPERVEAYQAHPFDLILAGHAHGGQWRLPGLINGLLAPNQGLFPSYAGGSYDLGGTALIVSRGLARESTQIPRLFNPPELVIVDVIPE